MDVVARERPVGAPLSRLNRVRCTHCAMPVRGNHPTCWSCGLDPTRPSDLEAPVLDSNAGIGRRPSGQRLLLVAGLTLVLVVLLGCVTLLGSPDGSHGVRGLAARIRGDGWQRADVAGATAEFPGPPVHGTLPVGAGSRKLAATISASGRGLRAQLVVADMADMADTADTADMAVPADTGVWADMPVTAGGGERAGRAASGLEPAAMAEELVTAYAAAAGGQVVERRPSTSGAPGLVALVEGPGGPVRVRVTIAGTTGYLMAGAGPVQAFERFTGSFRPAPTDATRPLRT